MSLIRLCVCAYGRVPRFIWVAGKHTPQLSVPVKYVCLTGKPVWGESGELVCLKPIPCQPTHFWNDENQSKYHKAYFSTYPGNHTNVV